MENSLDSILSGQSSTPAPEPQQPVETQAAAPEVQEQEDTGEQTGTPPDAQKDDPLEKHSKGLEAAAAAERKKRQAAEARALELETQLRALQQPQQPPQQQQAKPPQPEGSDDPKPLRQDFQSEDEWLDARDEWRDRQAVKAREQEAREKQEREVADKSRMVLAEASAIEGFSLEAFARTPITEPMLDAILDSEAAAKLVHHLTVNQDEARRIASLSHAKQIKELTRLEDKLSQPAPQADEDDPDTPAKPQKPAVRLPETLTQTRNARGQFSNTGYSGPTPLNAILTK